MKKRIGKSILSIGLSIMVLAGCADTSQSTGIKKVAIIQLVDHTSLNTIKSSFDARMKELGYVDGENVEYVFKNAQNSVDTAGSIIQDFKAQNPDVIMTITTPMAQSAAPLSKDIPIVFAAVSDPIGAKLTTSLEKPDKNMTGTSDEIQVELILEKALQINPSLKKLGMIYNKGEANSVTNIEKAKAYAKSKNIEIVEATITNINEAQTAITMLSSQCDAVFAPNDNTVASAMNVVGRVCADAKVPLYVGADSMVQDGGFLSVGINYEELGKETANMVDRILKGEKPENIPVKVFKDSLKLYVNEGVLAKLKITLPEKLKNDPALQYIN